MQGISIISHGFLRKPITKIIIPISINMDTQRPSITLNTSSPIIITASRNDPLLTQNPNEPTLVIAISRVKMLDVSLTS